VFAFQALAPCKDTAWPGQATDDALAYADAPASTAGGIISTLALTEANLLLSGPARLVGFARVSSRKVILKRHVIDERRAVETKLAIASP
jgi:hypothetical protein